MPNQVEEQLREFLAWEREQRARGHTTAVLSQKVDDLKVAVHRIAADRLQDRQTLARYGRRLGRLESQVALMSTSSPAVPDWHADPSEITGTHQFAAAQKALERADELQERLDAEDERREWWRKQGVLWAGAIGVALIVAAVSGCVSFAVQRALGPPSPVAPPAVQPMPPSLPR